ncbi:hypothetical protein [Rhodococcus sp. NPDC055024]
MTDRPDVRDYLAALTDTELDNLLTEARTTPTAPGTVSAGRALYTGRPAGRTH